MRRLLPVLLLTATAGLAAADPGLPPRDGTLRYAVVREGERIGTQTVAFRRDGDSLTVETRADVQVTLLGIPLYNYHHRAQELWVDGRLDAFRSATDDNGEARRVEARLEGDMLAVLYNGRPRQAPAGTLPGSLWHPDTVKATTLFDTVRGKVWNIRVADRGVETVAVRGEIVPAHRYDISGDVTREIWYGAEGEIVRVRFPTSDGTWVTLELE